MSTKLEVLQEYCQRLEQELQTIQSISEAESLKETLCGELGETCRNEYLKEMLAEHAQKLIQQRFESL